MSTSGWESQKENIINFSECCFADGACSVIGKIAEFCNLKEEILNLSPDLNKLYQRSRKRKLGDKKVPPGSSSVKRSIDDTRFTLALLCINIGRCYNMLNGTESLMECIHYFRESLMWYPSSIEGGYHLGIHLRHRVTCSSELIDVEEIWRKAVSSLVVMGFPQPTPLVNDRSLSSQEDLMQSLILHREKEAGVNVLEALTLHYCQEGNMELATPLLEIKGYTYKLSQAILHYDLNPPLSCAKMPSHAMAVDGALPISLLRRLQYVFRPSSPYWSEHDYDFYNNASRKAGYFSYLYPFKEQAGPLNIIEQIVDRVCTMMVSQFPAIATEATVGESKYLE